MLFHTWTFAAFFLVAYPAYLALKGTRLRLPWLLLCSYVFYGWWNYRYLLLIAFTTSVDYLVVLGMARSRRKKPWLCASLLANLSVLGFFKYGDFVVNSLNALLAWLGAPYAIASPGTLLPAGFPYLLPVGISFFVFQSMSYTIDFYRGRIEQEPSFVRYATFVSLFPQLVAGPIERASHLLPQLRRTPRVTAADAADGLSLFVVGLFKKLVLADTLALYVDKVYAVPGQHQAPALLLATLAFAWQIYFDFSGYTDMARGVGRLLGIRLMLNFRNPYLATSLSDFWRRWHISLSTWFRDYVYIPLGGNRKGPARTYANMVLTMLVSGLWHGAAWHFVAWGGIHAAGRVVTRRLEGTAFYRERLPRCVKQALVFAFVSFAWIFFRAHTLADAWLIVTRILAGSLADPACPLLALGLVAAVWAYQFLYESRLRRLLEPAPVRIAFVIGMILYIAIVPTSGAKPFIYFQF
ncbi:MAG: MBOAT family protein [Candidatus Brocadiae bacterium]|nr:MBOAT family protein [Candidatus Brocadiia bacterium]